MPAMTNRIEGATNASLRQMLPDHRGLSLTRRIKAIFWWCYMHTEHSLPPAQILKTMPTDAVKRPGFCSYLFLRGLEHAEEVFTRV